MSEISSGDVMLPTALVLSLTMLEVQPETGGVRAGQGKSDVVWIASRGCPTRADIVAGIEALLGEPLDADRAVVVQAEGRIERLQPDRWVLRLSIRSPTGERARVLEGTTCQELGEVAVVLVAIAIDPSVEVPDGPQEPVAQSLPPDEGADVDGRQGEEHTAEGGGRRDRDVTNERESAAAAEQTVVSDARVSSEVRGSASVATGLLVGPLPGVAPGLRFSLGLSWRLLAVAIGASHWFEREVRLPGYAEAGGDLRLTTGDVRVCAVPSARRLHVPLCTGVELGVLAGQGFGVANPRTGRALWAAWIADAGLTIMPWSWLGFGARAVLVVPMTRSTFALDDIGSVHEVAPVGFQALAGVELRFP